MKKATIIKAISLAALTVAFAQPATAGFITDDYWGGTDSIGAPAQDIIGGDVYDIHSLNLSIIGTTLSVKINTNYAGHAGGASGTAYGDLFLAETWTPTGTAPYATDDASNGTVWTHALSLDGDLYNSDGDLRKAVSTRITNVNNTTSLYSLSGSNDDSAILSEDVTTGHFRTGQEVAVDKYNANPYATDTGLDGSFTINPDNFILFEIDIAGTDLEDWTSIALHWGMTCANDVIEGETIPEPAVLGLLAIGLIGMGVSRRKKS